MHVMTIDFSIMFDSELNLSLETKTTNLFPINSCVKSIN